MKTNKLSRGLFLLLKTIGFFIVFINLNSCKEDFNGYYDPPEGLEGPIYEQLSSDPDFSEFTKAIDKLPTLKNAINTSGLYTVFAPVNEAMLAYYSKIGKSSVDAFNMQDEADSLALSKLVNSHILYNMYFKINFDKFIDETENIATSFDFGRNDVYRFGSRFREPDYVYYDKKYEKNRIVRPGNKVLSIYTQEYLDKYKMSSDYEDLFGVVPGDFNIEGVQILEDKRDIAAKNGVIHGINKVIEVIPTIDRVLAEKNPYFSSLLENFVELEFSAVEGIDTIFYKNYLRGLGYNYSSDNNVGTILCPEIGEFNDFVDNNVLQKFDNTFDSIPIITALHLIAPYYVEGRRWLADIQDGVVNGVGDTIINPVISQKIVASNGLVYLTSDLILSSAFTTVVKTPLLDKKYSWFLEILFSVGFTNFIDILRYKGSDFTFLAPTNQALENFGVERIPEENGEFSFYLDGLKMYPRATDTLVNFFIIPDEKFDPTGVTYRWRQTRNGNFLLFQNGKINGTISCLDKEITDNGFTYTLEEVPLRPTLSVANYLNNTEENSIFVSIIKRWFSNQLSESTTATTTGETLEYLLGKGDGNNSFTVFVPTDAAFQDYKTTHSLGDYTTDSIWQDIAQYLIVSTRLFSENSFELKADNPLTTDSTKFVTIFRDIVYSPDNIFEKDHYAWIQKPVNQLKIKNQSGGEANIVTTYDIQAKNGVIHHIDKVLTPPLRQYPDNN